MWFFVKGVVYAILSVACFYGDAKTDRIWDELAIDSVKNCSFRRPELCGAHSVSYRRGFFKFRAIKRTSTRMGCSCCRVINLGFCGYDPPRATERLRQYL